MKADELESLDCTLIDVRTPEAYEEAHISGSVNYCVYQVDFLEKLPEAYPDKSTKLVVYGDGAPYRADLAAVGRLLFLGYADISILEGGLNQWLSDGRPVEGSGVSQSAPAGGRFPLDAERTKVRWVGRNLMNQYDGEIAASEGFIEVDSSGTPLAGEVTVDLRRMLCHDLTDESLAAGLIGHLASVDFFDVENFPEASFDLKSAEPIVDATYGMPNFRVKGSLSARGLSVELEIDALSSPSTAATSSNPLSISTALNWGPSTGPAVSLSDLACTW